MKASLIPKIICIVLFKKKLLIQISQPFKVHNKSSLNSQKYIMLRRLFEQCCSQPEMPNQITTPLFVKSLLAGDTGCSNFAIRCS